MTVQVAPFLREQRQFPNDDLKELANQSDHAYIDIAQKVNLRVIGIYADNFPALTGESWYIQGSSQKEGSLRQVYTFTGAGNISHGINWNSVSFISPKSYGVYTDGTNYYGAIFAGSVAIAGQISFYVTPTNIVVVVDAGAPAITTGEIVLEWVSQF